MSNTYSILLPESLHGYQRFLHTQRPILLGGFPTFFENFEKKVEYFPNIFPKVKSPTRTPIYTPQSILSLYTHFLTRLSYPHQLITHLSVIRHEDLKAGSSVCIDPLQNDIVSAHVAYPLLTREDYVKKIPRS